MNNSKELIYKNKWLIGIILVSFVLSLGYSFHFKIKPLVDARAYDVIAQNIASGQGFREDPSSVGILKDTSIVRAGPVYPYFLAGVYKIFGHSYGAVWIIQAVMHAVSAYLVYLTCLLIFADSENKKKIGLWSAAVFGLYPDLIEISAMLMTETLYLFLVCLSLYLFFLHIRRNSIQTLIIFSFIFSLATLTRPPVVFLALVALFYWFKKKRFSRILYFGIIMTIILTPWAVRNYQAYGKIMPFGAGGAYNFWIGNHPGANGEQEPGPELSAFFDSNTVLDSYNKSMSEFKSFVINSPGEFLKLTLIRANKYFSILRPMGFWFYSSGWKQLLFVAISVVFSFLVFVLSLGGVARCIRLKEKSLYYLLFFTIITPLILFISVVETRYRFQIYPFLAIFAAYFIQSFNQDKKKWLQTFSLAFIVILASGLLDGLVNFEQFREKLIDL